MLSEITRNRYQGLLATHAVAQQDVDNAVGTYNANKSIVEANQANVKQFETLQSFEKIYAPFDGIITARNTDVGQLISAGNSGTVKTDLFHISQPGKLRVYVNVPEQYSQAATPGLTAELTLAEFPGRQFQGKLVRTSESINYTTRTLIAEIDVNNPTGELLSGAYAQVHLKVPGQTSSYLVPVSALIFRSHGLQVAVVKNDAALLLPVTPGHDYGERIEIVSGLQAGDTVITNPPDSLVSGQKVVVVQAAATTATGGAS
jgi:RND family efflux transporter MFP subunit